MKNLISKKVVSFLMACIMVFSVSVPAFANDETIISTDTIYVEETGESVLYKVLIDNDDIRVVEASDARYTYNVTFNKSDRSMDTTITDMLSRNGSTQVIHIDLDQPNDSYKVSEDGQQEEVFSTPTSRVQIEQNTFSNFEYTKTFGSPNTWELRRPQPDNPLSTYYFTTKETDTNRSYLNTYMDYVEKINSQEFTCIASITASLFADYLVYLSGIATVLSGGTLTPAMVTAAAGAVGANALVVSNFVTLGSYWKYAYNYYFEVYSRKS